MAELGVISGVAGLISLGITVCKGVLAYYDAFRGSGDAIDRMCSSTENVGKTLLVISSTVTRGSFDKTTIALVETSVNRCAQGLDALKKKLEKIRSVRRDGTLKARLENAKRQTIYPFKESTLVKMREVCDDLRDNLTLAISALNVDAAVIAQQRFDAIMDITSAISKDIQDISTGITNLTTNVRTLRLGHEESIVADIYAWLTPLTTVFHNKHRECLSTKVRQDNGVQELLQRPEFKAWMSSMGTVLWCRGLPGIGKTINASYMIEFLQQKRRSADTGIAYIYFSYKDAEIQTPANIAASILQQLISVRPDYLNDLKDLYTKHKKENTRPSVGDIMVLLQSVVFSFSRVFVVIDALDECSDADNVRSILMTELKRLQSRLCLLVMSRPIPDLENLLEGAVRVAVEASMSDIKNYLQQRLESTGSMQKHMADEPSLRHTIISRITQKIKGMFLMARLYLDALMHKTTRRKIKTALETLPEGLDSIYEELMIRIKLQNPKDHAELAVKVLGWIFYTVRPLTVTEIQHALAIEQGDRYLDEDGIPNRDLLVSVCAGMVMINDNSDTISLVHYTTQEYFQRSGKRLLEHANRDITIICLTYLHFDVFRFAAADIASPEIIVHMLRDHPLLGYTAQHWGDHLKEACDETTIDQAVELLEDEERVHFVTWVKDYADNLAQGTYFRPRKEVIGLALASSFGLSIVASELIQRGSSVHQADSNGQTALHRAVGNGHANTTALLLDSGAEVNLRDQAGWTPLHQASSKSDEPIAKLLTEKGAAVNAVDGYNATPLYRAAEAGAERVVRILLNKRADVLVKNSYLQTALHRAADNGHIAVVDLLLKNGADPKAKDHYGYTPFYRAADQGHEDVAILLQTYESQH